jgi:ABC-type multidrug transport system fused ATPase/permease subunit
VDEMLGIKEPCLKNLFKLGLLSYTFLFIFSTFLLSNWRIGVGHVIVSVLFFVQFYSLLLFFQRRGVPCEVQYDGGSFSAPAFALGGLLMAFAAFSTGGDVLSILAYIVISTVMLILAIRLAKGSNRDSLFAHRR